MNFNFMDLDMYSKRIGLFYQSKDKISSKVGILLIIIYILTSLGLFIIKKHLFLIKNQNI